MSNKFQLIFWICFLGTLFLMLYILRDVLLPFVLSMALAYFLDPLADRLEEKGISRAVAVLIILFTAILFFIIIILNFVPVLIGQLVGLIDAMPGYLESITAMAQPYMDKISAYLPEFNLKSESNSALDLRGNIMSLIQQFLGTLLQSGQAIVNVLSLTFITPVITFYLLLDWDRMVAKVNSWWPRDHVETITGLFREIDAVLAGFVRGQGTVVLILSFYYIACLVMIGLNFGFAIGLAAGIVSFIPYIGAVVGFGLSTAVAIAQFGFGGEWYMIAVVIFVFLVGQFLEGNILTPKLVGKSVRLSEAWLIFALFAFGSLFGFIGMLIAVPAAATIGVLLRFALGQYMESPLYYGEAARNEESDEK